MYTYCDVMWCNCDATYGEVMCCYTIWCHVMWSYVRSCDVMSCPPLITKERLLKFQWQFYLMFKVWKRWGPGQVYLTLGSGGEMCVLWCTYMCLYVWCVCVNMCRYVSMFTAPHTANSSSALHATPYTTLHNTLHNVILQTTASHLAPHSLHSPPLLFTASPYIIVIITDLTLHPFRAARKERSLRLA